MRCALARGFAISGLFFNDPTQGAARGLACPGLLSIALIRAFGQELRRDLIRP